MENTNEMQAILAQIEKNTAKQARRGSLQCILTGVAVLCCIGILVMLSTLANRVDAVAGKVDALTEQTEKLQEDVSDLIGQVELILTNAVDVTQQLADADLQGLVEHADSLITSAGTQLDEVDLPGLIEQIETTLSESQVSMEEAMGKLNAIDVDALNQAIQDLAAVVAPLASLAGKFS